MMLFLLACDPGAEDTSPPPKDTDVTECTDSRTWYPDADGDTFGDPDGAAFIGCDPPGGFVLDGTDCDDVDPSVNPGEPEVCNNGADDDCDMKPISSRSRAKIATSSHSKVSRSTHPKPRLRGGGSPTCRKEQEEEVKEGRTKGMREQH